MGSGAKEQRGRWGWERTCRESAHVCLESQAAQLRLKGRGQGRSAPDRTWGIPGLGGSNGLDWKGGTLVPGTGEAESRAKASLCVLGSALGFGGWGVRGGGLVRRRKLSSLQRGAPGKRPTSPSPAASPAARQPTFCALGKAARPRPSACALAPGLDGPSRGEGWLVAGPGWAQRNADKDPGHGLGNH